MRNTLAFLAASVIAVGAIGYYLDWFSIRGTHAADGHKRYVLDVHSDKIGDDVHKAGTDLKNKVEERAKKAKEDKAGDAPRMSNAN